MSSINELIHGNAARAFEQGSNTAQRNIISILENYFALTQEPGDDGQVTDNPEWDAGFQAAMAIIKGLGQ